MERLLGPSEVQLHRAQCQQAEGFPPAVPQPPRSGERLQGDRPRPIPIFQAAKGQAEIVEQPDPALRIGGELQPRPQIDRRPLGIAEAQGNRAQVVQGLRLLLPVAETAPERERPAIACERLLERTTALREPAQAAERERLEIGIARPNAGPQLLFKRRSRPWVEPFAQQIAKFVQRRAAERRLVGQLDGRLKMPEGGRVVCRQAAAEPIVNQGQRVRAPTSSAERRACCKPETRSSPRFLSAATKAAYVAARIRSSGEAGCGNEIVKRYPGVAPTAVPSSNLTRASPALLAISSKASVPVA